MTIIFEYQEERRILASIPPYTPWLLSIEEHDAHLDLVLQVGGCSPRTLLGSDKILREYPQASKQHIHAAFSDLIDHTYTRLTERTNDIIDLKAAWDKVWPFDAGIPTISDQKSEMTTWKGCSAAFLWADVLQNLKEDFGEATVLAIFSSVQPFFSETKLILREESSFRREIICKRYLSAIHESIKSLFHDDIEINVI